MGTGPNTSIAVWVVTPNGLNLARKIQAQWPGVTVRCSRRLAAGNASPSIRPFRRLVQAVAEAFHGFDGHVFIMAAGIVVRAIAPWLKNKAVDPAVVVLDDQGRYAISLLAGHIGGANALAVRAAELLGATAVITTATEVNAKPAIDVIALQQGLAIENPDGIKAVNMALLMGKQIQVHDPYALITGALCPAGQCGRLSDLSSSAEKCPGVYVDDAGTPRRPHVLILRPASLVAGIGCNRRTSREEIQALLEDVCKTYGLSQKSLRKIASIDVKRDESGLLNLGQVLQVPIRFFSREELNLVRHVPNPSAMAAKHVGVQSVCEAAAILAAGQGPLIVPKQKSANVTVAIARHSSLSSASVPEV